MSEYLFPFRLFVRVAYAGSFSRAGRELGISQSSVSRIIAALEQDLGASLLSRTTREVILTDIGANYLETIEPILAAFEEANLSTKGSTELHGLLRVGLSPGLAIKKIMPKLSCFTSKFPTLHVELIADTILQEPSKDRYDVVLKLAPVDSTSAKARFIASFPQILVASREYLERSGAPQTPVDLMRHKVVACSSLQGIHPWLFFQGSRCVSVMIESKVATNISEVAVAAAINGMGIISVATWDCQHEIELGLLVRVLENWQMEDLQFHAEFPAGAVAKPAAKIFVDFLAQQFDPECC